MTARVNGDENLHILGWHLELVLAERKETTELSAM